MPIFLKFILNALPWIFRIGTLLGKDPVFKHRSKEDAGPWNLTELSAADRQTFADLTNQIMQMDEPERSQQYMNMKYQVIAASARNKRGYFIFDPMNIKHLTKIASYPDSILLRSLEIISIQSGMPWLVPQSTDGKSASSESVPKSVANEFEEDWEGVGIDDEADQQDRDSDLANP
jgi:hypothetical protein